MKSWSPLVMTAVASNGNLTQLYDPAGTAGSGLTTAGVEVRKPIEGIIYWLDVMPDGSNGGTIEIWDLNGADGGADVNTATVITDAQRATAVTLGKASLLWTQIFTGSSGARLAQQRPITFMHGLAARFYNSGPTGVCTLTVAVDGGNVKQPISG